MSKKSNWSQLKSQKPSDSVKYRDVYDQQQLERSEIADKQSPTSRVVLTVILTVFVFATCYVVGSFIGYFMDSFGGSGMFSMDLQSSVSEAAPEETSPYPGYDVKVGEHYYREKSTPDGMKWENEEGEIFDELPEEEVPVETQTNADGEVVTAPAHADNKPSKLSIAFRPTILKIFICSVISLMFFGIMHQFMMKNLKAQNMLSDTSDINQYKNDQHIALPEEVQRKFDWFPDVGAHSNVQVSSMISHVALTNKGLKKIDLAKRADKDIVDEDGDIEYYKGEILLDENGNAITEKKPIIDEKFMDALFEASGAPDDKAFRKYYDSTKIEYNPDGKDRTKQGGKWSTVAEMINNDWDFPLYEPQRPAGAYLVDTEPVNTMVLAITRAGKGQTVIEPTLDMWTREKRPNNMVINDPKGELLVKFYTRGTVRGFQIVQFNLINAMKTDIYNRVPRSVMKSYCCII